MLFCTGEVVHIFGFVSQNNRSFSAKAATGNMQMNVCGCVLIKLYLQKQVMGQIRPNDHSLPTSDGEECLYF